LGEGPPVPDELDVLGRLDGLEVVPGSQMAEERPDVHAGEFFFPKRQRHNRNVGRLDALAAELPVKGNVGVAVDGGDNSGLLAG